MMIARVIIILLILPLHEFAHAWAARRCGDDTAEASGRLTFNPFSHVDPIGAVMLLLTGFGWAKPVPISPARMRNPRKGIIWTSIAGPASNLIIAFLATILFRFLLWIPISTESMYNTIYIIVTILEFFISVNIGLAVFNLIPVPPLDGSKVLMGFLPPHAVIWMQKHQQAIYIIFLLLLFSDFLDVPLAFLRTWVMKGFVFLTDWVPLLFDAIAG